MSAINTKANADITAGLSIGDFTAGLFAASVAGRAPFAATLLDVTTFQSVVSGAFLSADATGRAFFAATVLNVATFQSAVSGAFLSADATGRALIAAGFYDATTALSVLGVDSLTNANLLQLVQNGAFAATAATRALFAAGVITTTELATDVRGINLVADPGTGTAIPVDQSAQFDLTTGAAGEVNTLAAPTFNGQTLILSLGVDGGGNRVVTATPAINQAGNTIITFADANDCVILRGVTLNGVLTWRVVMEDSTAGAGFIT